MRCTLLPNHHDNLPQLMYLCKIYRLMKYLFMCNVNYCHSLQCLYTCKVHHWYDLPQSLPCYMTIIIQNQLHHSLYLSTVEVMIILLVVMMLLIHVMTLLRLLPLTFVLIFITTAIYIMQCTILSKLYYYYCYG